MVVGATGTLCDPALPIFQCANPSLAAYFKCDGVHWAVHQSGWEFEVAEEPGARWREFAARCDDHIHRIRNTNDDGIYARIYAKDVERLLQTLRNVAVEDVALVDRAFGVTRDAP